MDMAKKLEGIVSKRTIHELLPFIVNVDEERMRMKKETER